MVEESQEMITEQEELARLRSATPLSAKLTRAYLIPLRVRCPGNAHIVLERTKELLSLVLQYLIRYPIDYESEPPEFSIDEPYWRATLPGWFVAQVPLEKDRILPLKERAADQRNKEQWCVEAWLYWFLSPDEVRNWIWWDAAISDKDSFLVRVEANDFVFLWRALHCAMLAAGATSAGLEGLPD